MNTKKIIQEEFKNLQKKYKIIDCGLDWLRLWLENENRFIYDLKKYKYNSTTGNAIYNYKWFDLVLKTKWKQGTNYSFIRNINFNWFEQPINFLSITETNEKNKIWYRFLINFYWIFFQLWRIQKIDIEEEINNILQNEKAKITRFDYNFNFSIKNKKELQEIIKRLSRKYEDLSSKSLINLETFYIRYFQSKGRNKQTDKKINSETRTLGVKWYDKTQNILDLWIENIYIQYHNKSVLRMEFILGSKALNNKNKKIYWTNIQDLENLVKSKIFWNEKIIDSQNQKKEEFKTRDYIKRTKSMTESYLSKYLKSWWDIEDLNIQWYKLLDYLDKKNEVDEIIFYQKKRLVK